MPRAKKNVRLQYTEASLKDALLSIKNGMAIRRAAKDFGVPRATLFDKVKGRTMIERKIGRDPYLTKAEENDIVR